MDCGLVPTRGGFSGTISFPEHFASNWVTVSLPAYAATKFLLCMDLKERESDKGEKVAASEVWNGHTYIVWSLSGAPKAKASLESSAMTYLERNTQTQLNTEMLVVIIIPFWLPVCPVFVKLQTLDLAESSVLHDVQNVHVRRPLETQHGQWWSVI